MTTIDNINGSYTQVDGHCDNIPPRGLLKSRLRTRRFLHIFFAIEKVDGDHSRFPPLSICRAAQENRNRRPEALASYHPRMIPESDSRRLATGMEDSPVSPLV